MPSDLEAAVARLKRDLDAIAAETSGAKEARGDVRLLLADWERLRTEEYGWKEGYDNQRREKWQEEDLRLKGDIHHSEQMNDALEQLRQEEHSRTTAERERDALRVELERLTKLNEDLLTYQELGGTCAYCKATHLKEEMPAHIEQCSKHPMAAMKAELARLRERDARVREVLAGLVARYCANIGTPCEFIACITPSGPMPEWEAAKEALALFKETP